LPKGIDDRPIAKKAQSGDQRAYEILLNNYNKLIYRLIYRLTHDAEACEELTQETFVKAFEKLSYYDAKKPFYPWLCRIAVNLSLNWNRDKKEIMGYNDELDSPLSSRDISDELHTKYAVIDVEQAIEMLSPSLKAAIVLRIYEDLSYKEIAEVLNISIGTVMSRIYRAREELRKLCSHILEGDQQQDLKAGRKK
jgi:RNA polymerase sigma-70 factor (ECF subfamily)